MESPFSLDGDQTRRSFVRRSCILSDEETDENSRPFKIHEYRNAVRMAGKLVPDVLERRTLTLSVIVDEKHTVSRISLVSKRSKSSRVIKNDERSRGTDPPPHGPRVLVCDEKKNKVKRIGRYRVTKEERERERGMNRE